MLRFIHFALISVLVHCNCSVFIHLLDVSNYITELLFLVSSRFFVLLENFQSIGDVTNPGEGLQIVTFDGTCGHGAVRVLLRATPSIIRDIRGPVTHIPIAKRLALEMSLHVLST